MNQVHACILEALGSIVETRAYLRKMERILEDVPIPDLMAVRENLQGALRESETVLSRVTLLFNDYREKPFKP